MVCLLNLFENVDINASQYIGPIIVLVITMLLIAFLCRVISKSWSKELTNYLFGLGIIVSFFIWAFPMNMGFYDFFK